MARKPRANGDIDRRALKKDLAEALEQQAATSEILRIISSSRADAQPVFDTIARSAAQLCNAEFCHVFRFDGTLLHFAAHHGLTPEKFEIGRRLYPMPPGRATAATRSILSGTLEQIPDVRADPDYGHGPFAKNVNYRSIVAVPMLRDGVPIGAIAVARSRAGRFPERQLELLKTFADQAVIAIENVRLFNEVQSRNGELTESLERQTSTSEILRVISQSPRDVQPVFDTIAAAAMKLCRANSGNVFRFDGELIHLAALANFDVQAATAMREVFPRPPSRDTAVTRAILTRSVVAIPDVLDDPDYVIGATAISGGFRSTVSVPLIRDGDPIGAISVGRAEPGPFSDAQIALLQTFADQAVIAIENVRLFKELESRNSELTEALEQQTATSGILRVISQSPTDVQPVFDTIAASAVKLCSARSANVFTYDGELVHLAAQMNVDPGYREAVGRVYPRPLSRDTAVLRAIQTRGVVAIPDVLDDKDYMSALGVHATSGGFRSVIAVPLMREGHAIGGIAVGRAEPGPFPDAQIALLKTFADQAVIAIENVRLFRELETRNRDLTETLEQQTATSEILRVISRSPRDVQPVFDTIAAASLKLCHATSAAVFTYDGELMHVGAIANLDPEIAAAITRGFPRPPGRYFAVSRAVLLSSVVAIPDVLEDTEYDKAIALTGGYRSALAVPLMREGKVIGGLAVHRPEPGLFPEKQVALLKTFADQAVIAIENVRLFTELEARNRDLTEALEQQTATSDILRVISQSPTDVQPVFDTIAAAAFKLCRASSAVVTTLDGELLRLAALANVSPEGADAVRRRYPRPPGRGNAASRAVLTHRVVVIPDVLEDREYEILDPLLAAGFRSVAAVPLMRDENPIGAITVVRPEPGAFPDKQIALLQTFAAQAVIAIENVRLFNETTEALERQTATAEILKVISSSPTNVQPVFEAIAERAKALCEAEFGFVATYDGALIHQGASVGPSPEALELHRAGYPMKPGTGSVTARVVLRGEPVQIEDMLADPAYEHKIAAERGGFRSGMGVPMLRDGKVVGAIVVVRTEAGKFSARHVGLLQTFADQAVIAIENVRLFNETKEALEHQKASAEVLGVISSSVADTQPVFDKILESCERLFEGHHVGMTLLGDDNLIRLGGYRGPGGEAFAKTFPYRLGSDSATGTSILERRLVHFANVQTDDGVPERMRASSFLTNTKTQVLAPMIWKDRAIGAIFVGRPVVRPFSEKEIALLRTFADQAVIAIENVRLFTELETRNRDLTEALEQQTATSDILRVISQSQREVQPVFDTIAAAALKLCHANSSAVMTFDGELIHLVATVSVNPTGANLVRSIFPRPPSRDMAATRAILTRSVVAIPDVLEDPDFSVKPVALATGFRSALSVPLMRDGSPIGAITAGRPEPGPFPDKQVALLQTFADQAVIAIENARLFKELEARTAQLTRSVGELKALGEVGQAVSSTLDLETVLSTIVSRASHLAGMDGGSIWEYDEEREEFHVHATDRLPHALVEVLRATPIRKGEGALGRLAMTGEPVEIRDFVDERSYQSRLREALIRFGYRSVLAVPLLREDHLLGALAVNRKSPGEFAPQVVELLKTFATQSALAIQNARLFREIEEKSRQLEIASQHKSEFLANMSHELRTPLNAIIGFSEVLSERMFGEVNEKQAEYLGDILESGRHLLSLINDILDLSKIEAGRMELEASDFDLPSAIENTLILVRERAQRRGIGLGHAVDKHLGMIHADERKVKQVLLNLLSNALKFTPEGGRIDVRAAAHDGVAEISVADTGVGIAPEDQAAVFEEFRQVGSAAKKSEGTGLGLAISRKFIELHGGRIWVESRVGTGSTFTFTLPHES